MIVIGNIKESYDYLVDFNNLFAEFAKLMDDEVRVRKNARLVQGPASQKRRTFTNRNRKRGDQRKSKQMK